MSKEPLVSDPDIYHGTCVTQVPWCMSGSLTRGGGENGKTFPAFPAHVQSAILCICQEAHGWSINGAAHSVAPTCPYITTMFTYVNLHKVSSCQGCSYLCRCVFRSSIRQPHPNHWLNEQFVFSFISHRMLFFLKLPVMWPINYFLPCFSIIHLTIPLCRSILLTSYVHIMCQNLTT